MTARPIRPRRSPLTLTCAAWGEHVQSVLDDERPSDPDTSGQLGLRLLPPAFEVPPEPTDPNGKLLDVLKDDTRTFLSLQKGEEVAPCFSLGLG